MNRVQWEFLAVRRRCEILISALSQIERELVILVIAREVGCEVCVTMHTRILQRLEQGALAEKLVAGVALEDPRLDALAALGPSSRWPGTVAPVRSFPSSCADAP